MISYLMTGLVVFFVFFIFISMFINWKNTRHLQKPLRNFDKLPKLDSSEAKKEIRRMWDEITERKFGRKMNDEEFEEVFKEMKEGIEKLFKS